MTVKASKTHSKGYTFPAPFNEEQFEKDVTTIIETRQRLANMGCRVVLEVQAPNGEGFRHKPASLGTFKRLWTGRA